MKRQINRTLWLATVMMLLSSGVAWGYYDPNLQRWINRDPITEPGFQSLAEAADSDPMAGPNLYAFVKNNPIDQNDGLGLAVSSKPCSPAEKKKCEKVCEKKGKKAFRCTIDSFRVKIPGCPGLWTPGWVQINLMNCECAKWH